MSWHGSSGLRPWLVQRLSAVYITAAVIFMVFSWLDGAPQDYAAWRAWVAQPPVNMVLAVLVVALLAHAWVGVRDVIMDYVPSLAGRYLLLSGFALVCLFCLFAGLRALLAVAA